MMSAAKMVADSTQSDLPEKTTKKRKKEQQKKKGRKKKAEKKSRKKASEDEFDENDLDLDTVVRPLGFYVKDREEMLRQMFHCVKGSSLQRTMPDVLKELPLDDLQKRCLEQLEVMSKKRIRRIIAGDDPASISSSGTEDDTSEEEEEEEQELDWVEAGQWEETEDVGEGQMVDSTSHYTSEFADSDREFDEHEEGSWGHSSRSRTPSEGHPPVDQEDITNLEFYEDSQDSEPTEAVQQHTEVDDETEEGEVTDDDTKEVSENTKIAIVNIETADDSNKEGINNQNSNSDGMVENADNGEERDMEKEIDSDSGELAEEEAEAVEVDRETDDAEEAQGSGGRVVLPPSSEAIAPVLTKNQMELLELEMRARAIKAMLKTAK